ncbi:MAG: S8 family serine peptidase [Saprospiraceae bacterium]|nr:S8 family serine peptidase [Saprospiraceae bacterium]
MLISNIEKINKNLKDNYYKIEYNSKINDLDIQKELIEATNKFEKVEKEAIGSGTFSTNDPEFYNQWYLKNDGNFPLSPSKLGADINIENAWNITTGNESTIVAIIDSGCKLDSEEFEGRIWKNPGEIDGNNIDDDNNGYIDDMNGWNFIANNNILLDDNGHGTFNTGLIGANSNNNIGISGINWKCKLMILKGLNSANTGNVTSWSQAIYYAVNNGAQIINLSLGTYGTSSLLQNAIEYAIQNGVIVVASMGNLNNNYILYPAGYADVVAVGATNPNDYRAIWGTFSGSNFGNHISVTAPGENILSFDNNGNYVFRSGTSTATAITTGTISLLKGYFTEKSNKEIKSILYNSANDTIGNPNEDIIGWDQYYGYGRINAFKSLNSSILALEIDDFYGNNIHNKNEIFWKTNKNNSKNVVYNLERSIDTKNWEVIYSSAVTNQDIIKYIDLNPFPIVTYYRLNIANFDGESQYSNIIYLKNKNKSTIVAKILNNIILSNQLTVNIFSESEKTIHLKVYDTKGIEHKQIKYFCNIGSSVIQIDTENYNSGNYFITIQDLSNQLITLPFIVSRY